MAACLFIGWFLSAAAAGQQLEASENSSIRPLICSDMVQLDSVITAKLIQLSFCFIELSNMNTFIPSGYKLFSLLQRL
jgi:hypothetical protein